MTYAYTNNANSTLAANIGPAATTLTVSTGEGTLFPSSGTFLCTLCKVSSGIEYAWEIVSATRSGDVFTITRAQEGTTAGSYLTGDRVSLRVTAGQVDAMATLTGGAVPHTTGGTGLTVTPTNGQIPIGNGSGYSLATLTAGSNITVTNAAGTITIASTASSVPVNLSGSTTIYVSQVVAYTITDYDSFATYTASVSSGSVSIAADVVTVAAPGTAGSVTLTLTKNAAPRAITLTILASGVSTPSITSPANAATGVLGPSLTLTSSAFGWLGVSDTHLNSDWQLATDAGFATIVQSTSADTTNKTSWTTTVATGTTYYARVRHRGTANGVSAYSATVTFSTAATFNAYIATPTATPAAFGDAFEGGYYTGMIWNELVQSASSFAIGTGSKNFTVADMTATPLVYPGQTLEVRSRANPANKMIGVVTGALSTTLTINITSVGGSGTFTDWSIMAKYRVIVAPKASGENASVAYKNANDAAPTACQTLSEGRKATLAMVAAGSSTVYPAAHWCNNLSIAGKTDWYLPARDELELCWRNLKPTADANYASADRPTGATPNYMNLGSYGDTANTHGLSNNTDPVGAAHSAGAPAQVAAGKNFRTGESEAFAYGSSGYWSASEYSTTNAWTQFWHSSYPGYQNFNAKPSAYSVRAVRRSII